MDKLNAYMLWGSDSLISPRCVGSKHPGPPEPNPAMHSSYSTGEDKKLTEPFCTVWSVDKRLDMHPWFLIRLPLPDEKGSSRHGDIINRGRLVLNLNVYIYRLRDRDLVEHAMLFLNSILYCAVVQKRI